MGYDISEKKRQFYREVSIRAIERKRLAGEVDGLIPVHPVNIPSYDPSVLMPPLSRCVLRSLSLFSGGGGLDLGFDLGGYIHLASYEILEVCGDTLHQNRPGWVVRTGNSGDVRTVNWEKEHPEIDVIHGGPPCQPFSVAGHRHGRNDERDMWPEFIRAVIALKPRAFVAENVPGLIQSRFAHYVQSAIVDPLKHYYIKKFILAAPHFGVPQSRKRIFFVGFRDRSDFKRYSPPSPTHFVHNRTIFGQEKCLYVRQALGLPDIGYDDLSPTLRSGFTGPRNTTGVINSQASLKKWAKLQIWPHGVAPSREDARKFPPENGYFRLSAQDCALIQGFPPSWRFAGAVYQVLGQIGNSVCPPVAYHLAVSVRRALLRED